MSLDKINTVFQRKYNVWFKQLRQNTWQYPKCGRNEKCRPCLRFKTESGKLPNLDNYTGLGPSKLTPCQVGFIAYHKCLPFNRTTDNNVKLTISHICGNGTNKKNSLCIEGSHMILESKEKNNKRQKCHNYIRQFIYECQRFNDVNTTGTIKVIDVNKRLTQKGIEYLKKYKKRHYCKCKSKKCFINYGKIN